MSNSPRHRDAGPGTRRPSDDTSCVLADRWPDDFAVSDATTVVAALGDTAVRPALVARPLAPAAAPAPSPLPKPPRSFGRRMIAWSGRMTRRTLALALLLTVAWFWAVPFFLPLTSRAVVNARTVQVRAPINGQISALSVGVGDPVVAGGPVLALAGRNVDITQLAALRGRHAELTARRAKLALDLADTAAGEADCRADLERYQQAVVDNLRATYREGEAKVKMAELERQGADRRFGRMRQLADQQVVGSTEHDDHRDTAAVAVARTDLEQAGLSRTKKEMEAAERGLFVNRDVPLFQLQAREMAFKVPRLKAEIRETEHLAAATERALREEEARVGGLSDATVPAPVTGVVWRRPGNLAHTVERNEVIFDIADRKTMFVEALIHQRYLSTVAPGSRAVVNLTGGATLTGRVRAVRTPNPDEVEVGFALSLTDRDVKQVKVVVELDPSAGDAALIGRHARVLVTAADPGPVERAVEWVFTRVRF